MSSSTRPTKYVFVTGGVVSALGKGIVAASLGRLLKARGLRVQAQKFDPYLNVDPGTMSPFQHGEVFVTEDGAETDLDIGHYERFIDENLTRAASHTAGAIWDSVLRKERKGEFLGATVQVIPHITNEIKTRIRASAVSTPTDVVISEIGGTVGDIESLPFLEAIRQFRREVGAENVLYLHVTLVPFLEAAGELKTKPTQHSVNELRRIGIHPDIVVCRSHEELSARHPREDRALRRRRARSRDREPGRSRRLPRSLAAEGGRARPARRREARPAAGRSGPRRLARSERADPAERRGRRDRARRQVREAAGRVPLGARGAEARRRTPRRNGAACAGSTPRGCRSRRRRELLEQVDGVLVPGGFGSRGWEGKILACRVARERRDPVPRHLPRHARRGLRVLPARARPRRRQLDRDGSRDASSRDRPASRAEGDRGPRRHDAARCAGGRAGRGHARARGLRRAGRARAPPSSLRGEQPLPARARRRPGSSCRGRSRRDGSSRSSSCPTTPGSSRASSIRSSSRGRRGRRRCSATSSAPRSSARASARPSAQLPLSRH